MRSADWFWRLLFNGLSSLPFESGSVGCRWRGLRDDGMAIPHEPFPRFKATVASASYICLSLTVRKAVSLHQIIQSHLASRPVHVH